MSELRTNRIIPRDGLPSGSSGGIIQVKQTVLDTVFTSNSTSYTDVTGMSVIITPQRSDSKILVMVNLRCSMNQSDRSVSYTHLTLPTTHYV